MNRELVEAVNLIAATSGYNDKLELLRKFESVPHFKETLKFIYNPYVKTGISNSKITQAVENARGISVDSTLDIPYIISYFSKNQTGRLVDIEIAARFIKYAQSMDESFVPLAMSIVTQDLKIGITSTSLNAVYGKDFIPKIGCMLGTLLSDVGPAAVKWPCIVTEKLDGIRRILIKENGVCRMYSRSGHEDTGLVDILEEAKYLPDNTVYDGELLAIGEFENSIALRQASNSIANSKGEKHGLTFNVFDMVPIHQFFGSEKSEIALTRKIMLGAVFNDDSISMLTSEAYRICAAVAVNHKFEFIKSVPILGYVKGMHEVGDIVEPIWRRGGEGVMLNTSSGLYEIKRSKQLLKIKQTIEVAVPVLNMVEGSGKFEGMMGALVVEYKGALVGVGSGFTEAQRRDIWDNPDKYIGRKVEIETFGESTNVAGGTSLNCPIFKRFVDEVE